jgi:hypothetical protein
VSARADPRPAATADAPIADARAALARAETELLTALVAAAPPPAGFDANRLRIQAEALIAKRAAVVARLRPDLTEDLGDQFATLFYRYARNHSRPAAGARADAAEFVHSLSPSRPKTIRRWLKRRFEGFSGLRARRPPSSGATTGNPIGKIDRADSAHTPTTPRSTSPRHAIPPPTPDAWLGWPTTRRGHACSSMRCRWGFIRSIRHYE